MSGVRIRWSEPLPRRFYDRDTERVAQDLLGRVLARKCDGSYRLGRIIETEAYLGFADPASHVGAGRFTPRTEDVWGHPGTAYVFLAYGLHRCFNAVTLSSEPYGAVLVRGLEPLGVTAGRAAPAGKAVRDGPGKVTRYLKIGLVHNGEDLLSGNPRILSARFTPSGVMRTRRVGISKAVSRPLRFVATGFRER